MNLPKCLDVECPKTGRKFSIRTSAYDFQTVAVDDRPMGPEYQYEAEVNKKCPCGNCHIIRYTCFDYVGDVYASLETDTPTEKMKCTVRTNKKRCKKVDNTLPLF